MRKITTILVLLFVLSVSVFAEGDVPTGGSKSCPQGQVCFTEGDVPLGGKTDGTTHSGGISDNSITENIFDFLISIF